MIVARNLFMNVLDHFDQLNSISIMLGKERMVTMSMPTFILNVTVISENTLLNENTKKRNRIIEVIQLR